MADIQVALINASIVLADVGGLGPLEKRPLFGYPGELRKPTP